jgi:hypothetical protein
MLQSLPGSPLIEGDLVNQRNQAQHSRVYPLSSKIVTFGASPRAGTESLSGFTNAEVQLVVEEWNQLSFRFCA